jgi:hypothetical protein
MQNKYIVEYSHCAIMLFHNIVNPQYTHSLIVLFRYSDIPQ